MAAKTWDRREADDMTKLIKRAGIQDTEQWLTSQWLQDYFTDPKGGVGVSFSFGGPASGGASSSNPSVMGGNPGLNLTRSQWLKLLKAGATYGLAQGGDIGADLPHLPQLEGPGGPGAGAPPPYPGAPRGRRRGGGGGGSAGGGAAPTPPGGQAPLTPEQLAELMESYGSLLGGAGGGVSFSGGGGGNFSDPLKGDLTNAVREDLNAAPLTLNPRYMALMDDLLSEAKAQNGVIPELDPETSAQLDAVLAARLSEVEANHEREQDDLVARLYAGGTQQSSIGAYHGGELLYRRDQIESAARGEDAGQRLNARFQLADQMSQNLALRGQLVGQQQDAALRDLGFQVEQLERGRDRRASLYDGAMDREAQLESSRMSANATMGAASASASASRYNALLDFVMGDRRLSAEDRWQAQDATLRNRALDIQNREVGLRGRELNLRDQWFQQEDSWRRAEFEEGKRRWESEFGLDERALATGQYNSDRDRKDKEREQWLSTLGIIISAFA